MSSKLSSAPRRIGVVIHSSGSYWMSMIRGVFDTVRQYGDLEASLIRPTNSGPAFDLAGTQEHYNAYIVRVNSIFLHASLLAVRIPIVNVSGALQSSPFHRVGVDDEMVGDMAARYLVSLGLRRFVYCGDPSGFSIRRHAGFVNTLSTLRKQCLSLVPMAPSRSIYWADRISEILKSADATTLGVFATNDDNADAIMAQFPSRGIRVPWSVAMLGVDNEELAQNRASPPLSTIEVPTYSIGCEAVHLAVRLMNKEKNVPDSILLPPCRVITRASTDILAVENPSLRAAIEFIKKHADRPIGVDDVVGSVDSVPKRTLQRRFVDETGNTIQEYIRATRLTLCKELLRDTTLSIKEVAFKAGFGSQSQFTKFFRVEEAMAPQEYRSRLQRR